MTRKEIIEEAQSKYAQIRLLKVQLWKLLRESSPTWLDDIFELKHWTYDPEFAPPEISVDCDELILAADCFCVKLEYLSHVYTFRVYPDKVEEVV